MENHLVKTEDGDILEKDWRCARCGHIYHWMRNILSDVSHECSHLTCSVCGYDGWEDCEED